MRQGRAHWAWLFSLVLTLLPALAPAQQEMAQQEATPRVVRPLPSLAPVVQKVIPAVVNITASRMVADVPPPVLRDPRLWRFYEEGEVPEAEVESTGSGIVADPRLGYIVTNNHVIKDAEKITVTLNTGHQFQAELVAVDLPTDIAVIKIEPDREVPLRGVDWGNSEDLQAGDWVVAIGNPFGLEQSVTAGVVSALGRSGLGIQSYENFIQTDVSINPGSSGGALVNLRGEVIGINNIILAPSGGNIGISFAIPSDMVQRVVGQLIADGHVERGHIGVLVQDLTPQLAEAAHTRRLRGALVAGVQPDSPAADAGLQAGDIILQVDEAPVRNTGSLRNMVGFRDIGEQLQVKVLRGGEMQTVTLRVAELPEDYAESSPVALPEDTDV